MESAQPHRHLAEMATLPNPPKAIAQSIMGIKCLVHNPFTEKASIGKMGK